MNLDDQMLEFLQAGNALTPAIGEEKWRCLAVHSAVSRLRRRGHFIVCKMRRSTEGRSYGEYRLMPTRQAALPLEEAHA